MVEHTYLAQHRDSQNRYQQTLHFHDINEILFSLNDGCSLFLDDQIYDIRRGVLALIPEGTIHRKVNPSNVQVDTYTLHYHASLLDAYSTPLTDLAAVYGARVLCLQLPEEDIPQATALFERCLAQPDGTYGSDLRRNLYFLDILLQFYPLLSTGRKGDRPPSNITPLVAELIGYINGHLTQRLSLDLLANAFFTSKFNLCRQFKKETGFTIVEYINSSRVRKACSLLRQESAVADIGLRVGFPNASHFNHTFRQYTGMTPRQYMQHFKSFTGVPFFNSFTPAESCN